MNYDEWKTTEPRPRIRPYCLCEDCSNDIYAYEPYYEVFGMNYCPHCIDAHYRHSTDEDETCSFCGCGIPENDLAYKMNDQWICDMCMSDCMRDD